MTTQRYITGDNAPGYLPEGDNRGPWNSWRDACADLARMIDDASEEHADNAEDAHAAQAIVDATFMAQAIVTAAQHRPLGDELKHGLDLLFMGRAYFVYPAEAESEAPEGWRVAGGPTDAPAYHLEAGRVIVAASGLRLVYIDRQIPGQLDAILPTEADRFAHQIVDALNAAPNPAERPAPALQFDRVAIEALIKRAETETIYDYAEDMAEIVDDLLALALASCAPPTIAKRTLDILNACQAGDKLTVGARVKVGPGALPNGGDLIEYELTEAGWIVAV